MIFIAQSTEPELTPDEVVLGVSSTVGVSNILSNA